MGADKYRRWIIMTSRNSFIFELRIDKNISLLTSFRTRRIGVVDIVPGAINEIAHRVKGHNQQNF